MVDKSRDQSPAAVTAAAKAASRTGKISARTAARAAAVQALYQMDLAGTDLNDVIADFLDQRFETAKDDEIISGADRLFFSDILRSVLRLQRDIDPLVDAQLAEGWSLVRVDSILRAILRAGVGELMDRQDVPGRVVINEYVTVAKFFLSDDDPKVINGVLDKLARRLRSSEFAPKPSASAPPAVDADPGTDT